MQHERKLLGIFNNEKGMPVNSLKYKGNKFYGIRFLSYLISKRFTRMSIFYATVTINAIVTWHTKMPTTMRKIHVG